MTAGSPGTERLDSLDVLRGITIAGMLLVNNPGSWSHIYPPLAHAAWNGWTPTDLVFPFFLFMVGMAMMFSFPKRLARGDSRRSLMLHVVRRAAALMLLGWWGSTWGMLLWPGDGWAPSAGGVLLRLGYPAAVLAAVVLLAGVERRRLWTGVAAGGAALFLVGLALSGLHDSLIEAIRTIRIPGVLVRIAWCYMLASAIYFLTPGRRAILWWIAGLLGAYAVWMLLVPIPGFGLPDLGRGFPGADTPASELFSNWCFYIDYHVLGAHTWGVRQLYDASGALIWSFDPEGVLSTIPATASVLFGVLAGQWMRRPEARPEQTLNGLFVAGAWLLVLGIVISIWMPINKRIWTSSYTVFTSGMALMWLAVLYHLLDMRRWRTWAGPFRSYGRNAIFAFVASGMMATAFGRIQVAGGQSLKAWIYEALEGAFGVPRIASLVFALGFVAIWAAVAVWMDRRRIYFKV